MRMIPTLGIVVALGLAMIVLSGLGVTGFFGDNGGQVALEEEVEQEAQEDRDVSPEEGNNGGFISFVLSGLDDLTDLMGMAVFLPNTLRSLGAPAVVARAIGHGVQLVIALGTIKVAISNQVE